MEAPWHNRYLAGRFLLHGAGAFVYGKYVTFSATYYFLSRIVNAKMAQLASKDPDYNSRINQLALSLPADCVDPRFSIAQLWVWRKA
jgi:hypothetical protein